MSMFAYLVTVDRERPDFRVIWSLLWSEEIPIDSDGNSQTPDSRTWTELDMSSRVNPTERIVIQLAQQVPLTLEVASPQHPLALITALYLRDFCGSDVRDQDNNPVDLRSRLTQIRGILDAEAALERARNSIWHRSTRDNPYPNLP